MMIDDSDSIKEYRHKHLNTLEISQKFSHTCDKNSKFSTNTHNQQL